jgi:hypothetical protein
MTRTDDLAGFPSPRSPGADASNTGGTPKTKKKKVPSKSNLVGARPGSPLLVSPGHTSTGTSSSPNRKTKAAPTGVSDSIVIPFYEEESIPGKKVATMRRSSELKKEEETNKEANENTNSSSSQQDKKEEEDSDDKVALQEDVYSLMFTEGFGMVWLFSFSIVSMQLIIILLFYKDLLQDGSDGNRMNIPINVDNQITIAQFLAMPLAIMSHGDCTEAIYLLSRKYDSKIRETYPDATPFSWQMALFLRFTVGFLLIFISFIQIMQAQRLTELFLNLEAIVFVGNLDNFGFWLAQKGFLKKEFQDAAARVGQVTMGPTPHGWHRTTIRRFVLLVTWGILIMGWMIIALRQWNGSYLEAAACQSFTVHFGEDALSLRRKDINTDGTIRSSFNIIPPVGEVDMEFLYSFFSGTYKLGKNQDNGRLEIYNKRAVYYESVDSSQTSFKDKGKFRYCKGSSDSGDSEGKWIFTIEAFENAFDRDDEEDPDCKKWLMRSPPTSAFTLEDVPTEGWRVWIGPSNGGSVTVASNFVVTCDDCDASVDCSYHGKCAKDNANSCDCADVYLGNRCEIDPPCPILWADLAGESSLDYFKHGPFYLVMSDGTFVKKEGIPKKDLLLINERPVYVRDLVEDSISKELVYWVLLYSGSRWFLTSWPQDEAIKVLFTAREVEPFHSFWNEVYKYSTIDFSGPTSAGTPAGVTGWQEPMNSKSRGDFGYFLATYPFNMVFRCSWEDVKSCEDLPKDYCGGYGNCTNGACECTNCFGGRYCEYSAFEPYAAPAYAPALTEINTYSVEFWADPNTCPGIVFAPVSNVTSRRLTHFAHFVTNGTLDPTLVG